MLSQAVPPIPARGLRCSPAQRPPSGPYGAVRIRGESVEREVVAGSPLRRYCHARIHPGLRAHGEPGPPGSRPGFKDCVGTPVSTHVEYTVPFVSLTYRSRLAPEGLQTALTSAPGYIVTSESGGYHQFHHTVPAGSVTNRPPYRDHRRAGNIVTWPSIANHSVALNDCVNTLLGPDPNVRLRCWQSPP
jgi:hypothetical protein